MIRRTMRSMMIAGAVAAACIGAGTADAATAPPQVAPSQAAGSSSPSWWVQQGGYDYYLALGDSLAYGIQPNAQGVELGSGHGYADNLAAYLRDHGTPKLNYVNLSCPGETTTTMLEGGCPALAQIGNPYTVQITAATQFLAAHPKSRILVTLDIGANNVDGCDVNGTIDPTCIEQGIGAAGSDLPKLLGALKTAAGKHVTILGMNYYDPFLAAWLTGSSGQTLARESVTLSATFNGVLDSVYAAFNAPVADVYDAFKTADLTDTTTLGGMTVPVDVANICNWTWMCVPPPVNPSSVSMSGQTFTPNIHPNDAGYFVIFRTFVPLLPNRFHH